MESEMSHYFFDWLTATAIKEDAMSKLFLVVLFVTIYWILARKHIPDLKVKLPQLSERVYQLSLAGIAEAGIILRLYRLTASPLWYDEAWTILVSRQPLSQLVAATAGDYHPPLFYMLLSPFAHLVRATPEWLRLVPFVISVITGWLLWKLCQRMQLSRGATLIAMALYSFSLVEMYFAREIRMYALLQLLVLIQLISIMDLEKPRCRWMFAIATVAALYTHYYAIFYTGVIVLISLIREWSRTGRITKTVGLSLISGGLFVPWGVVVLSQQMAAVGSGTHWIQPVTFGQILGAVSTITSGYTDSSLVIATFVIVSFMWVFALVYGVERKRLILVIWVFGVVVAAGVSALIRPLILHRGFLACLPGLFMLIGDALAEARPLRRIAGSVVLLVVLVPGVGWQIGSAITGREKGLPWMDLRSLPTGTNVYIEDTLLITAMAYDQPGVTNLMLDDGCTEDVCALSRQSRDGVGVKYIRPDELPEQYNFVGVIGPLTTRCHEAEYWQYAVGYKLQGVSSQYVVAGEYNHDSRQ